MIKGQIYIDGQWCEGSSGTYLKAINPATGEKIGEYVEGTRQDAQKAIAAANKAEAILAEMSVRERSELCFALADAIDQRKEELARVISLEQGKPFKGEALGEVIGSLQAVREAAEQIKWMESSYIPTADKNKNVFTVRQPRGTYAIITPWNFPVSIPLQYIGPCLAAGNSIVWVPAPTTTLVAVKLIECLEDANLPKGIINLVTGLGNVVGDEIVHNPGTAGIAFTGSPATGKIIAERGAGKALLLELGGNGPTIILDDANLERAVADASTGCYFNAGQICVSTERVLVHEAVHDEVVERFKAVASKIVLGDAFDEKTTMGPLNNEAVASKMDQHIADAVAKGAVVVTGGKRRPELGSNLFFEPTIVTGVTTDCLIQTEESFGPIAPIMKFSSDEEAIAIANGSGLGLACGVFTRDMGRAMRYAREIKTGIFNINGGCNWWELHIPFGGASGTGSGVGRLGGTHTIEAMSDLKVISFDVKGFE